MQWQSNKKQKQKQCHTISESYQHTYKISMQIKGRGKQ